MKNIFLLILFFSMISFGQTESENSKKVALQFEQFYNSGDYKSIFEMENTEMQKALPLDAISQFLTSLKSDSGKILKREFVNYQKGSYAQYKTEFENTTYALNISIDKESKINGLFVKAFIDETIPKIERNSTKLDLPFKEKWTVVWGGDTKELNYHVESEMQKNAFDIVVFGKNGRTFKNKGLVNEDYYAFGKELISPCDGEVVNVIDGVLDNEKVSGENNTKDVTGNTVVIKTANNEFLFLCHFKLNSIKVKFGDTVTKGQLLGLCGNSGRSSEPHLHFHIQNTKNINSGTGIKCYFEKILVNGVEKLDYSPIQNEKIEPKKMP